MEKRRTFNSLFVINVLVLVVCVHLSNGQNITSSTQAVLPTENKPMNHSFCVQKCCKLNDVLKMKNNTVTNEYSNNNTTLDTVVYKVFESNETHIRMDGYDANITICETCYKNKENITLIYFTTEVLGLTLHNMSAIFFDQTFNGLIPRQSYCIFRKKNKGDLNKTVKFAILLNSFGGPVAPNKAAALYFPALIISSLCFFASAIFYIFVLNVTDRNNKKCFVGYTISMGFSFLCLVLLQMEGNCACGVIGIFFLLFTIAGFVWLTFLCLDLALDIIYFEEGYESKTLWITYLIASILIPVVVALTSVGKKVPDIPNTFIKHYNKTAILCSFENSNIFTFFVPIGTALFFSVICIGISFYYIHHNNLLHSSHYPWLDKRSKYKYMCISYTLIWITLCIWIVEAAMAATMKEESFMNIALDLIEAFQGIFAILIFVSDRYTRREVSRKCRNNSYSRTEEMVETELSSHFGPEMRNETSNLIQNNVPTQD